MHHTVHHIVSALFTYVHNLSIHNCVYAYIATVFAWLSMYVKHKLPVNQMKNQPDILAVKRPYRTLSRLTTASTQCRIMQ